MRTGKDIINLAHSVDLEAEVYRFENSSGCYAILTKDWPRIERINEMYEADNITELYNIIEQSDVIQSRINQGRVRTEPGIESNTGV